MIPKTNRTIGKNTKVISVILAKWEPINRNSIRSSFTYSI